MESLARYKINIELFSSYYAMGVGIVYNISQTEYKVKICDHILDNIYGQIGITEVEKEIERLPIFKRLHNISQLGLVKWIFPCALHTRYTHSIGVMHIAGEMASHINTNMKKEFFCDSEIQILRLAGLLHDIGHYPLSHNIEDVYKGIHRVANYKKEPIAKNLKYYVNCPDFLIPETVMEAINDPEQKKDAQLHAYEEFRKNISGSFGFHHENIGSLVISSNSEIRKVILENFVLQKEDGKFVLNQFFAPSDKSTVSDDDVEHIVDALLVAIEHLIKGNYAYQQDSQISWLRKYSAMLQLIHSDLDADNLDYLLRDATFSGTSYGLMDMSVLLNCLYVKEFRYEDDSGNCSDWMKYVVGIMPKGVGAVEQFLFGKFMAYRQMILSKYVSILEAMISRICSDSIILEDKVFGGEKLLGMFKKDSFNNKYLGFSDFYVFNQLHVKMDEKKEELSEFDRAILSHLTHFRAFDLDATSKSECICVSANQQDIVNFFNKDELYQEFVSYFKKIKTKLGNELSLDGDDKALFSYRFECYPLTKQIPLDKFEEKFVYNEISSYARFELYYYRLGIGIPILDPSCEYSYSEEASGHPMHNKMPSLCVDTPLSALKDLYDLKFVSLRKYRICEYVE